MPSCDLRDQPLDTDLYVALEERLRKSLSISEKLVAENPNVPEYAASHVQSLYTADRSAAALAPARRGRDDACERPWPSNRRLSSSFPGPMRTSYGRRSCRNLWPKCLPIAVGRKRPASSLESAVAALDAAVEERAQGRLHPWHARPMLQEPVGRVESNGRRATGGRDVASGKGATHRAIARFSRSCCLSRTVVFVKLEPLPCIRSWEYLPCDIEPVCRWSF